LRRSQDFSALIRAMSAEARKFGDKHLGFEHLVLALSRGSVTKAGGLLAELGLTHKRALEVILNSYRQGSRYLDEEEALRSIGIEREALIEGVEANFGEGAISEGPSLTFTPQMMTLMGRAEVIALDLGDDESSSHHLLIAALLPGRETHPHIFEALGFSVDDLRDRALRMAEASQEMIKKYRTAVTERNRADQALGEDHRSEWRSLVVRSEEFDERVRALLSEGRAIGLEGRLLVEQLEGFLRDSGFTLIDASQNASSVFVMCNPALRQVVMLSVMEQKAGNMSTGWGRDLSKIPSWAKKSYFPFKGTA
jgi:ATP-dependent Clp protease ATP-binding subunit ClpA